MKIDRILFSEIVSIAKDGFTKTEIILRSEKNNYRNSKKNRTSTFFLHPKNIEKIYG